MKKNNQLILGLAISLAFVFQSTLGQNLDTIKINNKLSILNDRAFFNFPTYAANVKRGVDIMSADPNANEETRIVLDAGDMRLVFFAQEIFALGDKDLLANVTKQNGARDMKVKILSDKDSLQSILSTPTTFDTTKNAILVNSLLVRTQDNSLFRISAYINHEAYKLRTQFQKLSENVFSSLTKGTRKNNRQARQEKHDIFGTKKAFLFNLPVNYCITIDQQYDFQVVKLHKYQLYGDTNWVQLIIYTGDHPSLVYRDYGLAEADAKKVSGTFLDKKTDWLFFDIRNEGIYDKEQKIPSDNIEKGLMVHLAMISNQEKLIDELTKIAESIKLTDK